MLIHSLISHRGVRRRPGRSSSGTVKVCRKPSSARGYLPPEVSSEELDGMYHSAAMTWEAQQNSQGCLSACIQRSAYIAMASV
eukprot:COSAG01_NODE_1701_length_9447_cov_3.223363_11_plen_83_part_00